MELRTRLGPADGPPDQAADDRAHDADKGRGDDAHGVDAGQHGAGDEAHDETHDEGPKDVEHRDLLSPPSLSLRASLPGPAGLVTWGSLARITFSRRRRSGGGPARDDSGLASATSHADSGGVASSTGANLTAEPVARDCLMVCSPCGTGQHRMCQGAPGGRVSGNAAPRRSGLRELELSTGSTRPAVNPL